MIVSNHGVGKEIFEYLKTKLEIPENVVSLSLHLGVDQVLTIDCTYHAEAKDAE